MMIIITTITTFNLVPLLLSHGRGSPSSLFNEIVLDAIRNRDSRLARFRDASHDVIVKEAASRWIAFDPAAGKECKSAGIDSSWNKRSLQGLDLYVVAAVAVTSANEVIAKEWEDDISGSARGEQLEAKAMAMEASLAQKAAESGQVDIVCVDGSLVSRLLKSTPEAIASALKKYGNAIFISKTSESRAQFGAMGSKAGDIYYYRRASAGRAGFSVPQDSPFRGAPVVEIYARLRESMPVVRIEVIRGARGLGEQDAIKEIISMLRYHSVSGYPYCLKLAHKTCKVSNEDIDRLASIYSLQNEQGARDALNE
ncbi:MAG: DNA double-strand break repair nuclease NurA [Nitrososphaera sp.]